MCIAFRHKQIFCKRAGPFKDPRGGNKCKIKKRECYLSMNEKEKSSFCTGSVLLNLNFEKECINIYEDNSIFLKAYGDSAIILNYLFVIDICLFNYKVARLFCFIKLNLFIFLKIYLQYLLIYNKILVTVQHLYSYKSKSIETCLQRWNLGTSLRIT